MCKKESLGRYVLAVTVDLAIAIESDDNEADQWPDDVCCKCKNGRKGAPHLRLRIAQIACTRRAKNI